MRLLWNTRRVGAIAATIALLLLFLISRIEKKGEPRGTRYFSYPSSSATLYRPTSDDNPNASFTASELVDMCHNADSVHGHALSITRKWVLDASLNDMATNYIDACFPIEFATSQGGRSMGHCQDFTNYLVHSRARLTTDQFPENVQLQKLETCKTQSLFVHGEFPLLHILNRTTEASQMMKQAWMPNLEQIDWKQQWIFEKVDLVLCKTRITCTAIDKYLAASGISNPPATRFMSHSSVDVYQEVIDKGLEKRTKQDFNKFFHSYGASKRKHTLELVECWKRHPEWPVLTIVGIFKPDVFGKKRPKNLRIYRNLPIDRHRQLQFEHGVHICPSQAEGYGHYINEARALSALVITTNYPPMNEFVTDGESGVLVPAEGAGAFDHQMIAPYFPPEAAVSSEKICLAVERVMSLDLESRRRMGRNARIRYDQDTLLMVQNIQALEKELKKKSQQ